MDELEDGNLEEVSCHVVYKWECPQCNTDNDEEDDPQGEMVMCEGCYTRFTVAGVQ